MRRIPTFAVQVLALETRLMLSTTLASSALATSLARPPSAHCAVRRTDGARPGAECKLVIRRLAGGAAATGACRDDRDRVPDRDNSILNVCAAAGPAWPNARSSGIAGGEHRLSIRAPQLERVISRRSLLHPEHDAHVSDLLWRIPACPQLVWPVACATLIHVLLLSIGQRLVLGARVGCGSARGVSGYLRAALRTRLSGLFARFGRGSERCCVLDDVCACRSRGDPAPRALECVQRRVQ